MGAPFTVFGATGFVGAHLVRHLRAAGEEVRTPARDDTAPTGELGHVVYCIGMTADFRGRPFDTVEAHVCRAASVLENCVFRSFLYLSSTRVYGTTGNGIEDSPVSIEPANPGDLYNVTKLTGESLCLSHPSQAMRVARLSNVFGPACDGGAMATDNFLASLIRDAVGSGHVRLRTAPESAKDYIHIGDVVRALHHIAVAGTDRLYNVASGIDVSAADILAGLRRLTGCTVSAEPGAPVVRYPPIVTERLRAAFAPPDAPWNPERVVDRLGELVAECRDRTLSPAGEDL